MDNNFWQNLPKKRVAAGVLFFNENKQLLIMRPTYKEGWTIPGGHVDKDESPREACIREVKEEIGIGLKNPKFLCVDYKRDSSRKKGESLQFIFYGGILSFSDIAKIKLSKEELSEYKFVDAEEASALLNEGLSQRVKKCLEVAIKENKALYLEDMGLV